MTRRVIGIGSPFGADRAAWLVIEGLRGRIAADIELSALDRPGAALISWLNPEDDVTLIDAALGCPAGMSLVRVTPNQLSRCETRIDSHGEQLAETLALAAVLGRLPQRLTIYAIHIVADELLSANPQAPRGVDELIELLAKGLKEKASRPCTETPAETC